MAGMQETLAKATSHLREMTISQRLAITLGAVLVAGSLAWMVQWAARSEMVPLLHQSLEPDDLAQISAGLETLNEPYQVAGSQVLVRAAANRQDILARLQQADRMPSDTSIGFEELVKQSNPWISRAENDRRWTLAMQTEIEKVLRGFSGVKAASVFLNLNAQKTGFSRNRPENSASVTLTTRGGEPVSRALALSAARLVSGAVRGLPLKNVQVVDSGGRSALDWSAEESDSVAGLARRRRQLEQNTAGKIRSQLSYIPDVKVSVQVVLDHSSSTQNGTDYEEGALLTKRTTEEQSTRGARSESPGVQPNTSNVVAGAGGAEQHLTRSDNESTFTPSRTESSTSTPAGRIEKIYAAISVSQTYLAGVFARNNPDSEQAPTESQIEQVFEKQRQRIESQVEKLVYPTSLDQIAVDWHYDGLTARVAAAVEASTIEQTFDVAGRYGPVGGLALLALFAMFLTFRMAKAKVDGESFGLELGLPQEAIAAAKQAQNDLRSARKAKTGERESAGAIPMPVGESIEGVLDGQEVDQSLAQVGKMLEQVTSQAETDEEGIAALVEKWVESR